MCFDLQAAARWHLLFCVISYKNKIDPSVQIPHLNFAKREALLDLLTFLSARRRL
jgi:hypothetical protein